MERETHTVGGTTFSFPLLPPREEIASTVYTRLRGERDALLEKARKVKTVKRAVPRGFRGPKPGNGVFDPDPGKPGSVLEVKGRRFEVWSAAPSYLGRRAVWATVEGSTSFWLLNCDGNYCECDARGDRIKRREKRD